jgi:hypothetical protein
VTKGISAAWASGVAMLAMAMVNARINFPE